MKRIRRVFKIVANIVLCAAFVFGVCYAILLKAVPEIAYRLIPYRGYVIRTDSMVPTIPVGSLVISRNLAEGESPQPGDIITFHARRYTDSIILTHYFRESRMDGGALRYYTQPEGDHPYDGYVTRREDILGTYLFHIPYVGRIVDYLQSIYGVVMILAMILIWLMTRFMAAKESLPSAQGIELENVRYVRRDSSCRVSGEITNLYSQNLSYVGLILVLYDGEEKTVGRYTMNPLMENRLASGKTGRFCFAFPVDFPVDSCRVICYDVQLQYTGAAAQPLGKAKRRGIGVPCIK